MNEPKHTGSVDNSTLAGFSNTELNESCAH